VIALAQIESELDAFAPQAHAPAAAQRLLILAEQVLEHWIAAHDGAPTDDLQEGFRLLALHRQGAKGMPSFNACRETCREIAYHFNLMAAEPDSASTAQRQRMMALLVKHLLLFVSGKLQVAGLGEFCCASRPVRAAERIAS
jgi:hypothetical protein